MNSDNIKIDRNSEILYFEFEKALIENMKIDSFDIIQNQLRKLRKRLKLKVKKQLLIDEFFY